ncbi:MAG: DEAD/DEAH box helicase family protein [Chlamydiota bacterium]|nr:DEAD/DEAH box helicase family protein [Chlamydiota bacterium]
MNPDQGYRADYLFLPKAHIQNIEGIKASLTFPMEGRDDIVAWQDCEHHLRVPREFIDYDRYRTLPFGIKDVTPDQFPAINVGTTYDLRDSVQEIGKRSLVDNGSGVLSLSCGKGKTVISLHAWAEMGTPALVVVPTKDLAYQWKIRIVEHTDVREHEIGWVQGPVDTWQWKDKPIAIAIVHSLANSADDIPEEFRKHFGVVIYDEVHRLGAPYFNKAAAVGYGVRWGLSATPFRKDGLDSLYKYHTGNLLYQNLEHENIPEVFFYQTGVTASDQEMRALQDRYGDISLPRLYTWLGENEKRNKLIRRVVSESVEDGRVSLVLSERVSHLKDLHEHFPEDSGVIYGAVKGEDRPGILANNQVVFAITQLARDGLDRSDLNTVMITMPFTDKGRFEQIIGRSQRSEKPIVIIFEDAGIGPCKSMCNKLRRHLSQLKYPYFITTEDD